MADETPALQLWYKEVRLRTIMRKFRTEIGAACLIATCVLLAYWKIVFTRDYTYFWGVDLGGQYYPWYQFAGWAWKNGFVPLWDPFTRGGKLFFDEMQQGAFYPLNLIMFLLPAHNGGVDLRTMDALIVVSVLLAGVGEFLLLRYLRISRVASVAGSLIFALGGYTAFVAGHQSILGAVIWLPWIVLFFLRALETSGASRIRHSLWSGFFLGLALLAGHIQPPAHACLILGFFTLGYMFSRRPESSNRVRIIGLLVGAVLFSVAVAAIQLVPSYQYSLLAYRWSGGVQIAPGQRIPFDLQEIWSPAEYLSLLIPSATSHQLYLGVGALFLALVGAVASKHRLKSLLALGALLSFLYSWGRVSSLYSATYLLVPLIEKVPEAGRAFFVFQFFVAGLSALGADVLTHPLPKGLKRRFQIATNISLAVTLAIFTALLAAALRQVLQKKAIAPDSFVPLSTAAVMLLLSVGMLLCRRYRLVGLKSLRAGIVFLIAFDLVSFVQSHTPPKTAESSDRVYADSGTTKFLKRLPGPFRVVDLDGSLPLNFGDAYRIQSIYGYGASMRKDLHDFINSNRDRESAMRMLNVKYYVGRKDLPNLIRIHTDPQSGISVYEDALALPRLALVPSVSVADPLCLGAAMLGQPLDTHTAEMTSYQPNRIVVRARVSAAGYLWLSELAYPGWRVYVDGDPATLLVSDSIFRAVYLKPGNHAVVFAFRPATVFSGAAITLLACVVLAVSTAVRRRRGGMTGT